MEEMFGYLLLRFFFVFASGTTLSLAGYIEISRCGFELFGFFLYCVTGGFFK